VSEYPRWRPPYAQSQQQQDQNNQQHHAPDFHNAVVSSPTGLPSSTPSAEILHSAWSASELHHVRSIETAEKEERTSIDSAQDQLRWRGNPRMQALLKVGDYIIPPISFFFFFFFFCVAHHHYRY
jgi:hypothetical protein